MPKTTDKLSFKERKFTQEIVKHGNGTRAALAAYEVTNANPVTASAIAAENLRKPRIKSEIEALLVKNGITVDEITQLHSRNARQSKHLPTSQGAIRDFYDILGMRTTEKESSDIKIAFILEKS